MSENESIPFSSDQALEPQKIIDLFTGLFRSILASDVLTEHIQLVKSALYNRDYLSAFENDDKRFAYVARWTPARALAYLSLLLSFEPIVELFSDPERSSKALTIGGGAGAEIIALASVFGRSKEYHSKSPSNLEISVIDIADWSTVVKNLEGHVKENWVYDPLKFNAHFIHGDALEHPLSLQEYDLITLLFTTNELFAAKRAQSIQLLQNFNRNCKKGALLLIAESAGSYSHITIGSKKFPIQFLVDTILVGKPGQQGAWEIIKESDSCWYRMDTRQLNYPLKLENMRFFYRLYRKL